MQPAEPTETYRVAVAGGRKFRGVAHLCNVLDAIPASAIVVHGSQGASAIARMYAESNGIELVSVDSVDAMFSPKPGVLVAMVGGEGTARCVAKAAPAGVFVVRNIVDALAFMDNLPWRRWSDEFDNPRTVGA